MLRWGVQEGERNEEEVFSSLPVNDMQKMASEKTSSPPEALPGQASPGRLAGSRTGLQHSRLLHAEPGGLGCQKLFTTTNILLQYLTCDQ